MINYVKRFIYFIFSLFILLVIFNQVGIYNQTYIPSANGVQIQINQWNEKLSKEQIFENIQHYSDQYQQNISFVSSHFNDNKEIKYVYPFRDKPNVQAFSYIKNDNVQIVNKKRILLQDLCGTFMIDGTDEQAKKLMLFLNRQGIKGEINQPNVLTGFTLFDVSDQMMNTMMIVVLLLLILNVFEKINHCKKYSILKLNGSFLKQVWYMDLKKDIGFLGAMNGMLLIFMTIALSFYYTKQGLILFDTYLLLGLIIISFIFLLSNILSYAAVPLMDIKLALKNGMPSTAITILGYGLKIVILFVLAMNVAHLQRSIHEYKENKQILSMWNKQPTAYSVSILGRHYTEEQEEKISAKVKTLLSLQPYILVKNNEQRFHPAMNTISVDEGNVFVVNDNYIKQNTSLSHYIKDGGINVLIPNARKSQMKAIRAEVYDYIQFQKTLSNDDKVVNQKIHYISVPNQTNCFNWNTGEKLFESLSHNPLLIVVSKSDVSNNFYYACLTNNEILFEHLPSLKVHLKQSGLAPYVAGITSVKSKISQLFIKNKIDMSMIIIASCISLLQMIFVISFVFYSFVEKNKKLMALNIIHAVSNHRVLLPYMLWNMLLDSVVILLCWILFKASFIIYIGIGMIIMEGILLLISHQSCRQKLIQIINNGY